MIVISDTSPIHYLVLIDAIDVLPSLFGEILIPTAAHGELLHAHAPLPVRQWAATPPPWLTIRPALNVNPQLPLGIGEAEAISLAEEMSASLVLMDDRRARRELKLAVWLSPAPSQFSSMRRNAIYFSWRRQSENSARLISISPRRFCSER